MAKINNQAIIFTEECSFSCASLYVKEKNPAVQPAAKMPKITDRRSNADID
ncbi:MAG: hypothetical protein NTY36_04040 [Deltaproteobacteria bacterium]|nr:hypothetical protein [Deltaproteobacteria bacterium]